MGAKQIAPYGSWASPISSALIVADTVGLSDAGFDGEACTWQEQRPSEGGRNVVVRRSADGTLRDLTPPPFNARTRVHEYGGRAYLMHDGVLFFSNDADQRLHRAAPGEAPQPLTAPGRWRYADLCADASRSRLIAVREDHSEPGEPRSTLVALPWAPTEGGDAGSGTVVEEGADFYACPRISPDGSQLAWLAWQHPDMPWDGTELWLGELDAAGRITHRQRVAGGRGESICQPQWSPGGTLYFVSDRSGWWNLYRWQGGQVHALAPMQAEFGVPHWVFGSSTYAFESEATLICSYSQRGLSQLARLDTATLKLEPIATPFSVLGSVRAAPGRVLFTAASPTQPACVALLHLDSGRVELLRSASSQPVDAAFASVPQALEYPSRDGHSAHAFFYPPCHGGFEAPLGDKPPLLVLSHGGPTSQALSAYSPRVQYWTSRGFAVLDVNYGGSSGYGRAYRQRLNGQWGVVDVDDCVAGAQFLVRRGDVDGQRLAIRGGSAGGFTTLCALAFRDVFKAGASHYGIGDLEALAQDTHKFESRYLDHLVGPYPGESALYRARSAIHHLEGFSCPLILFQGSEDKVVPPEQSRRMFEAVKAKGLPVAYVEFEGEQHGFRQAANIRRALDAEAWFYARVFGFTLADAVAPVPVANLPG